MNSDSNISKDHYERVLSAMSTINYSASDLIRSTGMSVVYRTLDAEGNITHTTIERLYKYLQDDYDISTGAAESRIRKFKQHFLYDNENAELLNRVFGENWKSLTLYDFIIELAKYITTIW